MCSVNENFSCWYLEVCFISVHLYLMLLFYYLYLFSSLLSQITSAFSFLFLSYFFVGYGVKMIWLFDTFISLFLLSFPFLSSYIFLIQIHQEKNKNKQLISYSTRKKFSFCLRNKYREQKRVKLFFFMWQILYVYVVMLKMWFQFLFDFLMLFLLFFDTLFLNLFISTVTNLLLPMYIISYQRS